MKLNKLLALSCGLIAPLSFADVNIDIPRDVQILVVNGEDAGYSSFGFDYKENLHLNDGINQVVFRISKVVNESGNKSTKFKSKPLVATIESADSHLKLEVPNLKTLQSGYDFDSNPSFNVSTIDGEVEYFKQGQLRTLATFGSDFVQATENFNKSSEPASLAHLVSASTNPNKVTAPTPEKKVKATAQANTDLKSLFLNKSYQEKQEFLSWAIKNM
ncbi:DUF2057 family protein [Vibrio brasiliensis]|uniref:Uncharacterized protein n=1 Tax=Vibrio brasiliensis LMG 20546 TaxID=945543 RepID=E8M0L6_9VIBR|nr:DUF2057 family protein [Vibrio brasiliensis]EGA63541.1 hypothetical protein VIBR0546_09624 [Vibrio brasiliensis LMG 20546]